MLHALLCLSPAIALAIPLLARRYPGERTLLDLRSEAPRRLPRYLPLIELSRGVLVVSLVVRGGDLIARYLAVRPPPGVLATS